MYCRACRVLEGRIQGEIGKCYVRAPKLDEAGEREEPMARMTTGCVAARRRASDSSSIMAEVWQWDGGETGERREARDETHRCGEADGGAGVHVRGGVREGWRWWVATERIHGVYGSQSSQEARGWNEDGRRRPLDVCSEDEAMTG